MELDDKLISYWRPYLVGFAKKTKLPYGLELDDLIQELLIVLCECVLTFTPGRASFKTYLIGCTINRISTLQRDGKHQQAISLKGRVQVFQKPGENDSQVLDEYGIIDGFDREWLDMRMKNFTWREIVEEMQVPRSELIKSQRRLRRLVYGSR